MIHQTGDIVKYLTPSLLAYIDQWYFLPIDKE